MKRYAAFSDFQVLGRILDTISLGLGPSWRLASRLMLEEGLGTMGPDGLALFDPGQWYTLAGFLRAIDRIQRDLGEVAVRQMAATVPRIARLIEPTSADILTALGQVDVAYHANHALDGQPLYREETGVMMEGIGHYRVLAGAGPAQVLCECTNPYPCIFDQALLRAFAQPLNPSVTLVHLSPESCRARGSAQCTYALNWTEGTGGVTPRR